MKKLLYVLSFASFLSYFGVSIFGLNAKYDQLVIILIAVIVLGRTIFVTRSIYIDRAGVVLLALCAVSFFSSVINAPDVKYSLVQTVNLFSVAFVYILIPNIITTYEKLSDFIVFHLRVAKVYLILSTILFLVSYITNKELFGINLVQNDAIPFGVYFTMLEPNIYGSFMLIIFCISFVLYVSYTPIGTMQVSELRTVLIWSLIGIFISFTRGVWLAVALVLAWYYFTHSKNIYKTLRQASYIILGVIVLIYIGSEVLEIGFIQYKITNFFSTDQGTGLSRVNLWRSAVINWYEQQHFLFGNGTYSYASFFNRNAYDSKTNAWIGNVYITFLHDIGVIGLMIFLFYYSMIISTSWRNDIYMKLPNYLFIKNLNTGFLIALIGIALAFVFTTALTYSYPWILFGLVSAFNRINQREKKTFISELS